MAMPVGSVDVPAGLTQGPEQKYWRIKPQAERWQGYHCLLLLCFQPLPEDITWGRSQASNQEGAGSGACKLPPAFIDPVPGLGTVQLAPPQHSPLPQ